MHLRNCDLMDDVDFYLHISELCEADINLL